MSETIRTDMGYELTVYDTWDRDGELEIVFEAEDVQRTLYLNQAAVTRLRNALSIALGE